MSPHKHFQLGQCGSEKSGNYLLYRILRDILEQCGAWSSYSEKSRCWESLQRLNRIPFSFPEQRDLDEVELRDAQIYLKNSHLKASCAAWDRKALCRDAALIWTHQAPRDEHSLLLGSERRWLYMLRDGRDVVNSWIHYATSPRMLARHPEYQAKSADDLYAQDDYFERTVSRWAAHVESYLEMRNNYLEVRYEELVRTKESEIKRIADRLEVLDGLDVRSIAERTLPNQSRDHAPRHVRTARIGDWRKHFGARQRDIYQRRTRRLLDELGCADYQQW